MWRLSGSAANTNGPSVPGGATHTRPHPNSSASSEWLGGFFLNKKKVDYYFSCAFLPFCSKRPRPRVLKQGSFGVLFFFSNSLKERQQERTRGLSLEVVFLAYSAFLLFLAECVCCLLHASEGLLEVAGCGIGVWLCPECPSLKPPPFPLLEEINQTVPFGEVDSAPG